MNSPVGRTSRQSMRLLSFIFIAVVLTAPAMPTRACDPSRLCPPTPGATVRARIVHVPASGLNSLIPLEEKLPALRACIPHGSGWSAFLKVELTPGTDKTHVHLMDVVGGDARIQACVVAVLEGLDVPHSDGSTTRGHVTLRFRPWTEELRRKRFSCAWAWEPSTGPVGLKGNGRTSAMSLLGCHGFGHLSALGPFSGGHPALVGNPSTARCPHNEHDARQQPHAR